VLKKIGKLLIILSLANILFSQSVRLKVSSNRIELNEQVNLTLELENIKSKPALSLPEIQGFSILNPNNPHQNSSYQVVNGKVTQSFGFTFVLQAKAVGKHPIPSLSLTIDGKTYKTNSSMIEVIKENAAKADIKNNVFLRMTSSNRSPYINEEVTVQTKMYIRQGTQIYQNQINVNEAKYKGVWKESYELKGYEKLPAQTINGVRHDVYLISKDAIFPTAAGEIILESPEVVMKLVEMKKRQKRGNNPFDLFNDDLFGRSNASLIDHAAKAKSEKINVKSYPANIPDDFISFTGILNIRTSIDKKAVKTNDAVKLTITLSGNGNIQTLENPSFFISPDIEQYEPSSQTSLTKNTSKVSGKKTIEYVLVPRVPGQLKLGPFSISYMNSTTNKITTITSPEIILDVEKGKDFVAANQSLGNASNQKFVKQLDKDIRFIRTSSDSFQEIGSYVYQNALYIASFPAVLIFFLGAFKTLRDKEKISSDTSLKRSKEASSKVQKILKEAKAFKDSSDTSSFFPSITTAMTGFIADKTNQAAAGLTTEQINSTLKSKNVEEPVIKDILDVLESCDFYRFANPNNPTEEMERLYLKTSDLLSQLIKQL
jgi:hypothetical protein